MLSDELVTSTGAPQGCVLSLVLISIYNTNEITCNDPILTLIKYPDDMSPVGRLKDEFSLSQYYLQIDALTV